MAKDFIRVKLPIKSVKDFKTFITHELKIPAWYT